MSHSGLHKFTFPRKERLKSKKEIEGLFRDSSSFYLYPIVVKYQVSSSATCHKALFTVSKKNFKRAVDRNHIKRKLREAYRLNKHLLGDLNTFYNLAFVYVAKSTLTFHELEGKLKILLMRLKEDVSNQKES